MTASTSIRLVIPALSGPRTTSLPESVCARFSFRRMASGSSSMYTRPASVLEVVDIFEEGSWRSMMRAPTSGIRWSGSTSTSA